MYRFLTAFSLLWFFLPGAYSQVQPAVRPAESVSMTGYLLQGIFGLLIVLGLMWGAWWLIRRTGFNRTISGVKMKIVGGIAIGNRERVMIVEVGDHWLILGVTPSQINTLATMPKKDLPEEPVDATSPQFAVWLKKIMDRRKNEDEAS